MRSCLPAQSTSSREKCVGCIRWMGFADVMHEVNRQPLLTLQRFSRYSSVAGNAANDLREKHCVSRILPAFQAELMINTSPGSTSAHCLERMRCYEVLLVWLPCKHLPGRCSPSQMRFAARGNSQAIMGDGRGFLSPS